MDANYYTTYLKAYLTDTGCEKIYAEKVSGVGESDDLYYQQWTSTMNKSS